MYTEIDFVHTAGLLLLKHIALMLIVQELDNWHPRVAVVDIVAETWSVDHGKTDCEKVNCCLSLHRLSTRTLEELLLQLCLRDFDLNRLVNLLGMSALVIGVILNCGREECVDLRGVSFAAREKVLRRTDKCCLSKSRFTSNHNSERCSSFGDDLVTLIWASSAVSRLVRATS